MNYYVIGLGNPGNEYSNSRHNTGKMAVDFAIEKLKSRDLRLKKIESQEYMNHSGKPVAKIIKSKIAAKNLIVVYDDIDLPLGVFKIAWNRGSGGHKGLESVSKAIKTKEFIRIRIGISPSTPKGKVKKPGSSYTQKAHEKAVLDFILGKFKPSEMEILKKVFNKVSEAIECVVSEGREMAMNRFN